MTSLRNPTAGPTQPFSPSASQRAAFLIKLINDLKIPYGCERSFRLSPKVLLTHRFLLSLAKEAIPNSPNQKILDIGNSLQMPENLSREMERNLCSARFIHFGFEEGPTASLFKIYLELGVAIDEGSQPTSHNVPPVLLHLSYKWDPSRLRNGHVTRYFWYPSLSIDSIGGRLSGIYEAGGSAEGQRLAFHLLDLTSGRMGDNELKYLEVTEDDNERRSFDLNFYDAEMTVEDLFPVLQDMCRHLGIPQPQFETLYEDIKVCTLGHVAGGFHREGKEFFNVYYGVEGRHG